MKSIAQSVKNIGTGIWRHKGRTLLIIIGLLIIAFVVRSLTKPPAIIKATVVRQEMRQFVEASGRIKAKEAANLTVPPLSKIVWVGTKEGNLVRKGQTLVTMDSREVEKTIQSKMLDYMTARWDFEQLRDDHNVGGRPLIEENLSDAEKRILEQSQFGLDQSVLAYEIANLAREQTYLSSPVSGTVVDDGDLVAGERLSAADTSVRPLRIVNLNTLYYQAEIDESDYAQIKEGLPALIKLDSFPEATISGTVRSIGKEGIKKTGGGVQIMVEIGFDPSPLKLIPELTGDVQIITKENPSTLVLDKKFVTTKDGQYSVQIMKEGKLVAKPISVGLINAKTIEILSGLSEGDEVVMLSK